MKSTHLLGFFILLTVVSCNTDAKHPAQNATFLHGHWDLIDAEMNGQESPALEKIYYEFGAEDSLKTNFTLSEQDETGTFSIKEDRIIQHTAEPIEFQYTLKSDSTLEMTTALRGFDFRILLKKAY
jgi:hypothetical protein